ncbi:MAG: hypothetical protein PHZ04_04725 [Patescibacteria group bacterium]|nr:hypothetical protein [Patescibacteria group bacterium]MDD5294575.1 hypothetical protein [Patescibacteria group bacterium]MDD5554292.1 hypothetical protein [Patescibacteria group bacterium]
MKTFRWIKIFCICFFFLLPRIAFGLAGWGEFNTECYYTSEILINFGNPSDVCSPDYGDQTCFSLYKNYDRYHFKGFKKLGNLTSIGVPTSDKPKFIIGKSYYDSSWLIYDIEQDEKILQDSNYEKVLAEWKNLGNPEPTIANTKNFSKYFDNETEESKKWNAEQNKFAMFMLLFMSLPFVVPIIIIGIIIYLVKRKKRKKK